MFVRRAANAKLIIKTAKWRHCRALRRPIRVEAFSTRFLPSKRELNQMHVRRTVVGLVLGIHFGTPTERPTPGAEALGVDAVEEVVRCHRG